MTFERPPRSRIFGLRNLQRDVNKENDFSNKDVVHQVFLSTSRNPLSLVSYRIIIGLLNSVI